MDNMKWLLGIIVSMMVGCAAADSAGSGTRGKGAGPGGAATPGNGSAGASAAAPTDGFDNSSGPSPDFGSSGPLVPDGGACEVGKICYAGKDPDENNCGTLRLESNVKVTRSPGNLLVIFDQSGSMEEAWGTGGSKLQAAQNALVQALTPLQDSLTVGAIFFPTQICILAPPMGGAVAPIDAAGQIPFQPGPQFLTAWQNHWSTLGAGLGVGTPMQEAFDRADIAIQNATLDGPLVVVAFTDGQPNCFPVDGFGTNLAGIPTDTEPNRAASWLANRMIKTYMVGLPGGQGVQILNDVAVSGGTMQYIVPDDPAQLQMKLAEVVQETVKMGFDSCSVTLTPAANPPEKLMMIVDENGTRQNVPHDAGTNASWTISDDGTQVEITGGLCDDAKGGRFDAITFEYGCPDVPPPPTLPPVE